MSFEPSAYPNFVSEATRGQERLFLQYIGPGNDFDIVIIGSGIGGGILADDLAERLGTRMRILVLEAGSFIYPTHVYNLCRFPNASLRSTSAATPSGNPARRATGSSSARSRSWCSAAGPFSGLD